MVETSTENREASDKQCPGMTKRFIHGSLNFGSEVYGCVASKSHSSENVSLKSLSLESFEKLVLELGVFGAHINITIYIL